LALQIAINIVRYNHPITLMQTCIEAVLAQELCEYTVTLTENGSSDSVERTISALFGNNPKFNYADNRTNLGFAGAHNRFIARSPADIMLPLNPDTIMTPGYLQSLVSAFEDPKVGAATGKMLKLESSPDGSRLLDGTGIIMSKGRRGRERGQNEADKKQFDSSPHVFGVSGTASAYRKSALEAVRIWEHEYFDEDFFAYWEDLDLSWRLRLAGYEAIYVPDAVIYHLRIAGQSKSGYRRPLEFIKHHRKFPLSILRWNWKNQLFCIVKNDFGWSFWRDCPFIVARQILMLCYITVFEPQTLGAIPDFFRLLPKMLRKRKLIQDKRTVSSKEIGKWFVEK
jgi:GT2 family glycosyltransferase